MSPPICRVDTPVARVIQDLDHTGERRAVIVGLRDEYVCQISPSEIRRHLLTGLDSGQPIGAIAEPSPLLLRETELADAEQRRAVVLELEAAGHSHCAVVDSSGRLLRVVRCQDLLEPGRGPEKAQRMLGWEAEGPYREALARDVTWFRAAEGL